MYAKVANGLSQTKPFAATASICLLHGGIGLFDAIKAYMLKLGDSKKPFLFSCLVLSGTTVAWLAYFATHGSAFAGYFVPNPSNTSMDYFSMLALIYDMDPYADGQIYPAMCFLVWRVLYHFMPGTPQGGDALFLRDYMLAQLPYIFYTIVCILVISLCVRHLLRMTNSKAASAVVVALIASGPIIFTIERGNIILLVLASLMLFVCFYDSSKKWVRYLSYVCLAFAAAIKIYPAIFALLVLSKGRIKEFIHLAIIGVVVFVLPFFAFGGLEALGTMTRSLFVASEGSASMGLGYNFSFTILARLISALFGVNVQAVPFAFTIAAFVLCLVLFFLCKPTWQKAFLLALMCVWIPSFSYTYVLIFFIPAVALFLVDPARGKRDYLYLGLFVLLFIPYAFPDVAFVSAIRGGVGTGLPWGCLIINFVLVAFVATFIWELFSPQHTNKTTEISANNLSA